MSDVRWPLSPYTDEGLVALRDQHARMACFLIVRLDLDDAARDQAHRSEVYGKALHDRLEIRRGLL